MFITNNKKNLKERLEELISISEELKFLIGFFYFSGAQELYLPLKKNQKILLKILVGLKIDELNNQLIEYATTDDEKQSLEEIRNTFCYSLNKAFNRDEFDHQKYFEQAKYFVELIKNNQLIIRKTKKPNHSKLYIFNLKEKLTRDRIIITGSSNLTKYGLTTQDEFNIEISDYGTEEAERYFDELWENAVTITEDNSSKDRLIQIIEKQTPLREITPFEAYALVLKMYLETYPKKDTGHSLHQLFTEKGYTAYKYQIDAIEQALGIIENHGGVILADVVGLGKTVIACAIAKKLNKRGLIICPPGIVGDTTKKDAGWNMYVEQFQLYGWEVKSLGKLEEIQESFRNGNYQDVEVIIVDEAHRFKNQSTERYEQLKNICNGKIVILLTATPFNNRPDDILSLLKLFTIPKKSTITLENNLSIKFQIFQKTFDRISTIKKYYNSNDAKKQEQAHNEYQALFGEKFTSAHECIPKVMERAKYLAKQIRDIIEPVTIRRNRLDLLNNPVYKKEIQTLSKVKDPEEWFFELTKEQSSFYDIVIQEYFADPEEQGKFTGAIYRPSYYEQKKYLKENEEYEKISFEITQQNNLFNFMRRLLVKRFESSFGAFEQSIKNFKEKTEKILKFIHRTNKYILDRTFLEKLLDKDDEEIEVAFNKYVEELNKEGYPKNKIIFDLSEFEPEAREKFLQDIQSDINLYGQILKELKKLSLVTHDPKVECLINHLKKQLKKEPHRKIVIFSEYTDTIKYLQKHLEKHFPNNVLTAYGNISKEKLDNIYKNFDASLKSNEQENKYKILLATDKLSEGFNLNRAGMVINYDIPWNPVRVIQRVGRINRISKKVFNELYIVNFFPTEKGAELIKSREIASQKMFLIHNTLGEDAKIFDIDEEPTASELYKRIQQNPDEIEKESLYTQISKEFEKIKEKYPQLIKELDNLPPRIKLAKQYHENELLVFLKKNRLFIYQTPYDDENNNPQPALLQDILEHIRCTYNEPPLKLSDNFWEEYEKIKKIINKEENNNRSANSLEQKAYNTLKSLLNDNTYYKYHHFMEILIDDIQNYETLSDYTLRNIASIKKVKDIADIKNALGEDYLEKQKSRLKNFNKEIIISIENRKI